jgi:hypothetical protein
MFVHTNDFQHHAPVMRAVALGIGPDGDALTKVFLAAAVQILRLPYTLASMALPGKTSRGTK